MNGHPFGDLRDWGRALDELKARVEAGTLDEVQAGVARLVRYRDNWQLREQGLHAARRVRAPEAPLLNAVLAVATDADTYLDARILAVRALGDLLPRRGAVAVPDGLEPDAVVALLRQQLEVPEAPAFRLAVEKAITAIERMESAAPEIVA